MAVLVPCVRVARQEEGDVGVRRTDTQRNEGMMGGEGGRLEEAGQGGRTTWCAD